MAESKYKPASTEDVDDIDTKSSQEGDTDRIEPECLELLASDLELNIKELWICLVSDEDNHDVVGKPDVQEARRKAGAKGREVFLESVKAGKSLTQAEIDAFDCIFSERGPVTAEQRVEIEEDFVRALEEYCKSRKCFKFIK